MEGINGLSLSNGFMVVAIVLVTIVAIVNVLAWKFGRRK